MTDLGRALTALRTALDPLSVARRGGQPMGGQRTIVRVDHLEALLDDHKAMEDRARADHDARDPSAWMRYLQRLAGLIENLPDPMQGRAEVEGKGIMVDIRAKTIDGAQLGAQFLITWEAIHRTGIVAIEDAVALVERQVIRALQNHRPKTHEDQGTAYDPGAYGHERQGRRSKP